MDQLLELSFKERASSSTALSPFCCLEFKCPLAGKIEGAAKPGWEPYLLPSFYLTGKYPAVLFKLLFLFCHMQLKLPYFAVYNGFLLIFVRKK